MHRSVRKLSFGPLFNELKIHLANSYILELARRGGLLGLFLALVEMDVDVSVDVFDKDSPVATWCLPKFCRF